MRKQIFSFIVSTFIAATSTAQNNLPLKFSNIPFTTGNEAAKTSFKSNEFIYARAELGKTVKEYFKIEEPDNPSNPHVLIFKYKKSYTETSGKSYEDRFSNGDYMYVKTEDLTKTYINLDILPDPAAASDVFCKVSNFKGGKYTCPVYFLRLNEYKNNSTIKYTIQLVGGTTVTNDSDKENLPKVAGSFNLIVNHADELVIKQNEDLSSKKVQADGDKLSSLPPIFAKPFKTTDAKLQSAKLTAILKRDFPDRQVFKMALDSDGGATWLIAKNDFGIPRYRYFNGILHIAYKEDGVCKVGKVELIETYMGGGKYAQLSADYPSEYDRKINCTLIK